jgi:enolase
LIQLDGTDNKSRLGANAILAVSLACAKAAAADKKIALYQYLGGLNACMMPIPFVNIINGGAHADNKLDFQEFMIVPVGAFSFSHALQMAQETFHMLKQLLKNKSLSTMVGDEGGFAPLISDPKMVLDFICQAIEKAGYKIGDDIALALDIAASEFYHDNKYLVKGINRVTDANGLIQYYQELCQSYPIISIEDGLAEDDWNGWKLMTKSMGENTQLVGDDLFVTNSRKLEHGIQEKAANAILIKPNQVGTLSETLDVIRLAQKTGYRTIISHRSGETEDTTIADLAVAVNAGQIKTGSMSRTDRLAKYNQLLRIEESLGKSAIYPNKKNLFFPVVPRYSK